MISIVLVSCQFLREDDDRIPIARVNDVFLYEDDLSDILTQELSKNDSAIFVNNYINKWATQQLLMQGALINLSASEQEEFNKLVDQYKNDLYSKAYLQALVNKGLDTLVSFEEAKEYYDINKEAFKLNEELVKFRYINLDPNRNDLEDIEKKFKRFDAEDRMVLDSMSIQFKSYAFNDTIWIKLSQILDRIPAVGISNKPELLKKSNFIQIKDSIGLYLMQINDVLLQNDVAPLEYVKPTIDQIVINRRKLERIKELEKDITKDAIKNKKFEIYR